MKKGEEPPTIGPDKNKGRLLMYEIPMTEMSIWESERKIVFWLRTHNKDSSQKDYVTITRRIINFEAIRDDLKDYPKRLPSTLKSARHLQEQGEYVISLMLEYAGTATVVLPNGKEMI